MQRFIFWVMILLAIGLCALIYLKFTLPKQDSIVYFKDSSTSPLSGYVIKKDNYLVIAKDGNEQIFPWDEIKSVSGPNPIASESSIFSYWLDKIDFLSSLGVIAAITVFSVGLYQYQQGNLWKREEFLVGIIKDYSESPKAKNAKRMIEALAQDYDHVEIELYPERKEVKQSQVKLAKNEIISALNVPILNRDNSQMQRIREDFDTFFDYLETFDHYIELNIVSRKSMYVQISYWLNLLGRYDLLNPDYRNPINDYAACYQYYGYIKLLNRYNRKHRFWWKIKNLKVVEYSLNLKKIWIFISLINFYNTIKRKYNSLFKVHLSK